MKALGYWKGGKPDIARFAKANPGLDVRSLYPWMNGERLPEGENLVALANALQTTRGYLIFGDEPAAAPSAKNARH